MPDSKITQLNTARAAPFPDLHARLLHRLDQAAIGTDLQGTIIYWNEAAEKLYGWTAEEGLGRSILDVTPTAESASKAAEIFQLLKAGQGWTGDFTVRDKDGTWFSAQVSDI